jgi:uncharacterized protein YggE
MRRAVTTFLVSGVLGAGSFLSAAGQQVQVSQANRTISITTTDSAERRADVATLHVGYQLYAADSASVYGQAALVSQAVAAALEKEGVAKDAIASEGQSTGPVQPYPMQNLTPAERAQHAFEAAQSWTVKTTPDAVAGILAAAVRAGANNSGQIEWSLGDDAALTAEAGTKALAHAKGIATQMASGLGSKVGNLVYASNQVEAVAPRVRMEAMGGIAPAVKAGAPAKLSLRAPMITRSATVVAMFAIE